MQSAFDAAMFSAMSERPNVEFSGTPAALSPEAPLQRRVSHQEDKMPTKKQLEEEVEAIRAQLYQERQDHGNYVRHLKETAYKMARESMRVKMVLAERDGYDEALPIVRLEEGHDGVNVVVANA
jgi:hypothetical protein